jgi:hypothetical protein
MKWYLGREEERRKRGKSEVEFKKGGEVEKESENR